VEGKRTEVATTRGEPIIWIDWLKKSEGERLASFSAFQVVRGLSDDEKRHILHLLGGLYQLVFEQIQHPTEKDEQLFEFGRRWQEWATIMEKEGRKPRGGEA
jgi:hypothetical protein